MSTSLAYNLSFERNPSIFICKKSSEKKIIYKNYFTRTEYFAETNQKFSSVFIYIEQFDKISTQKWTIYNCN